MPEETLVFVVQLTLAAVGLALIAGAVAAGAWSRRAFRGAPRRQVGLAWWDIAVAIGLGVFGALLVGELIQPPYSALDQLIGTLIISGCPAVYLVARVAPTRYGLVRVGLIPRRPLRDLIATMSGCLFAIPVMLGVMVATSALFNALGNPPPEVAHELLEQMAREQNHLDFVLMLLMAVVAAPVLEEILFRGLIQTALLNELGTEYRRTIILATAVFFGGMHASAAAWQTLPALAVFGVILGWLYERTGSLWPPILVHAAFNVLNVLMVMAGTSAEGVG